MKMTYDQVSEWRTAHYNLRLDDPRPRVLVWGPDGLAVNPGEIYDWSALQDRLRECSNCNRENVDTMRVGFANRVCAECRAKMAPLLEKPGWAD